MISKIKNMDLKILFALCIFFSTIIFIILNCIFKGSIFTVADYHDHYMHYYGMIDKNNFLTGGLIFPPFAEMLYNLWSMSDQTATTYPDMVNNFPTTNSQYLYHIVTITIFLLYMSCMTYIFKKDSFIKRQFLSINLILSFPIIEALRIGNSVLPTCLFILIGLILYYNDDKNLKFLSLVFFALASALKYYPAIYGIILLKNKDYKNSIKLILLGILFFILPLFCFDGFATIPKIISSLKGFNGGLWAIGNIYYIAIVLIKSILKIDITQNVTALNLIRFFLILIGFIGVLIAQKRWKLLFYIGFLCNVCFINAWGYNTIYYLPAIIYFLFDENETINDLINQKKICKIIYSIIFILYLMNYTNGALHRSPIYFMVFIVLFEDIFTKFPLYKIKKMC